MRRPTRIREKQQPNETGGFRFAVTLLAALGTILYAAYIYFQNTPVDLYWYWFVCGLIPVALILIVGLLLYILIKGYSMEVQDSKYLAKWASRFYQGSFLMFIMLLVHIMCVSVFIYLKIEITTGIRVATLFISIMVGSFFTLPLLKKDIRKGIVILLYVFIVGAALIYPALFKPVLYSPLQGHVTVDMESIYYQNVSQIPVLIHVTGPNTGLSIYLVKKDSSQNLPPIENITLIPEQKPSYKTVSGKFLVGNTLDYGTYNVFINTTDLTAGYYELVCLRWGFNETYSKKGFYLLNSSEQSCIME